jgi:hypothetical protein
VIAADGQSHVRADTPAEVSPDTASQSLIVVKSALGSTTESGRTIPT